MPGSSGDTCRHTSYDCNLRQLCRDEHGDLRDGVPDEAKMLKKWRRGACPHLAIKPPDMGRPNTRISDVDRPALMVLMPLPLKPKPGLNAPPALM